MKTLSIPIPRALFLLAFAVGSLRAQEASLSQPGTEAAYLLRLERVRERQGVCVLLRGDGQYHLEHHTPDKIRVFEGALDSVEVRQLIHIVSGDQLYRLQQKQIEDPMVRSGADQVILSVLRPQYAWQELMFPDPPSREPYRESLVPLLDWLERLQKRKGRELSEDEGRNNCQPFANLELKVRPAKKGEPPSNSANARPAPIAGTTSGAVAAAPQETVVAGNAYVLRMVDSVFIRGTIEMSCTLITPSGPYHFVKQSRDSGAQKVRSKVIDGVVDKTQIEVLRQLLNAPELRTTPAVSGLPEVARRYSVGPTSTVIWFPRDGTIQKFEAWQAFQLVAGWPSQNLQQRGMKALLPLRQWMKLNLNESKAIVTANPANAKCMPEP